MSKDWDTVLGEILPADYQHSLAKNETVYPVFDLQNVDVTYYGNGATETDDKVTLPDGTEVDVSFADNEYQFTQENISNASKIKVAENPFYRIEDYTAADEKYYDENLEEYVDYTQYYKYVGWFNTRDGASTYNNGTYTLTQPNELVLNSNNWTKTFMDALSAGNVKYNADKSRATICLYATWDAAPVLWAVDRYMDFESARELIENGQMTNDLLKDIYVKAYDNEDHEDVTIELADYNEAEFLNILNSSADHGGASVTFKATDKVGNVTYYSVMVNLTNNVLHSEEPEVEEGQTTDPDHPEDNFQDEDGNWYHYVRDDSGNLVYQPTACYTRRLNLKNYLKHWESGYTVNDDGTITGTVNKAGNINGALETHSKWYEDEELAKEMYNALYTLEQGENADYIYSQTFSRATIKQMQDEMYSDPSKLQLEYIFNEWMDKYMDLSTWTKAS